MSVRPLCVAAVGILGAGLLLHIVGVATPAWAVHTYVYHEENITFLEHLEYGLWRVCINSSKCFIYDDIADPPLDFLKASQAMAILGMIASLGAIIAAGAVIYFIHTGHECPFLARVITLAASVLSAIFIIIAVIVFSKRVQELYGVSFKPGYSSALSCVASVLIIIGGAIDFHGARSLSP